MVANEQPSNPKGPFLREIRRRGLPSGDTLTFPARAGRRQGIEIEDIDSASGIVDGSGEDEFALIARAALQQGIGHSGQVGQARSHLFDADRLVRFGIDWMEQTFAAKRSDIHSHEP